MPQVKLPLVYGVSRKLLNTFGNYWKRGYLAYIASIYFWIFEI
jgi:hypothetical protein